MLLVPLIQSLLFFQALGLVLFSSGNDSPLSSTKNTVTILCTTIFFLSFLPDWMASLLLLFAFLSAGYLYS